MVPTVESQLLKTGWVNKDQLRTSVISRLLGFANHSPSVKTIQNELRLKKQKINSSDWFLLPWIFWEAKKKDGTSLRSQQNENDASKDQIDGSLSESATLLETKHVP